MSDDFYSDTIPLKPNCAAPSGGLELAVCTAKAPAAGSERERIVRAALDRIRARGPACAGIAEKGSALLGIGQIRFFNESDNPAAYGDSGAHGGSQFGAILDAEYWLRFVDGKDAMGRSFDNGLAHEIEHAQGRGHSDESAAYPTTANAFACGG